MPTLVIDPATLPSKQFTGGVISKTLGRPLSEVRPALDVLVDKGVLTVKVAKSGARNYSLTKGAKAAKVNGTLADTTKAAPVAGASTDKVERYELAKAESAALKAWQRNGGRGERPATPNLDACDAGAPTAKTTKAKTGSGKPRGTTVQFVHDGKPMAGSQNKLSSVAWYHTKGVLSEGSPRMSCDQLRNLLVDEGIADPANAAGWTVTLPNGVVLSTVAI